MVNQSERQAPSTTLCDRESYPDLEQRVDQGFLVFAEVDGSQADVFDDRFDGHAIYLRGGEEHVRGPVREDRVGQVLTSKRVEGTGVSDIGGKRCPAVGNGLTHLVGRVDHKFAGERVAMLRRQSGDRRAGQREDDDLGLRQRVSD